MILTGVFLLWGQSRVSLSLQKNIPVVQLDREERGYRANPDLFRLGTFGHAPAAVDLLLLSFLGDDRTGHVKSGRHANAFHLLDLATSVDPRFYHLYYYGANHLTVIRNDNPGAELLLEKATRFIETELAGYPENFHAEYWSQPWKIYLVKGYVELFELHKVEEAAQSYAKLAEYSSAPSVLRRLGGKMSSYIGILEVAYRSLTVMIQATHDPEQKERLLERIRDVEVSVQMHQVNEEYQKSKKFPARDPWGGELYLENGEVMTRTLYRRIGKPQSAADVNSGKKEQ